MSINLMCFHMYSFKGIVEIFEAKTFKALSSFFDVVLDNFDELLSHPYTSLFAEIIT